jgi:pimeloyl-ACP methyl ester carboxylesterase
MLAAMAPPIEEATVAVDGVEVFYRRSQGDGEPTVFVHGNPSHSEDWVPFIERLDGPAIAADLPGWGRSARPEGLDYSMWGLAEFHDRFLEALAVERHRLVVHDWGSLALIGAQRRPQRVSRLVVINAVPLLPGYRWHWVARWLWRVSGIGELANATMTKASLRLISRQATPRSGPLPDTLTESVWREWGGGTRRPILELYRSADPDRLAAAGAELSALRCPALIAWGAGDPYLPEGFGRAYAARLPGAELFSLPDAGHWPWLERPDLIDRVDAFLQSN